MTAALDWRALHLQHRHPCCWRFPGGAECGLWCGHEGDDHVPFTPGIYLPPPILTPIDRLVLAATRRFMRCPGCGARADCCTVRLDVFHRVIDDAARLFTGTETHWTFDPCGCTLRELHDREVIW